MGGFGFVVWLLVVYLICFVWVVCFGWLCCGDLFVADCDVLLWLLCFGCLVGLLVLVGFVGCLAVLLVVCGFLFLVGGCGVCWFWVCWC